MSPFLAFCLWALACWVVVALRESPLQPDRLDDDLADVDLTERSRQVELREADWLDRPVINLRLSRRGRRYGHW